MLLTTVQVAERLGIVTKTVMRMVSRGDIEPIRVHRKKFRFRESDFPPAGSSPEEIAMFLAALSEQREAREQAAS